MLKKLFAWILMFTLLFTSSSFCACAAQPVAQQEAVEQENGKWVKKRHKYFYVRDGKRLKGKVKIHKQYYYFDEKGVQRTGWQKIGNHYYFFNIKNGKKGYMRHKTTVNHIRLKKNGVAVTKGNKRRLQVLCAATQVVQKATRPDMKIGNKLRACFDYTIQHYQYRGDPKFYYSKDWEVEYAYRMMTEYHGSCYEYGAWFAFIANACGCRESIAVSSGGHGWSEINGRVSDPSWEQIDKRYSYYQVDLALSGKGGRPNYLKYGKYRKVI